MNPFWLKLWQIEAQGLNSMFKVFPFNPEQFATENSLIFVWGGGAGEGLSWR